MDNGLVQTYTCLINFDSLVLILVVVDNGLVRHCQEVRLLKRDCLNPCCSGQWSHTSCTLLMRTTKHCLNPCCSGQWSRTNENLFDSDKAIES